MKHKDWIYVGEPIPELDPQEHAEFLALLQIGILASLEKRQLLTHSQHDLCLAALQEILHKEQRVKR